MKCRYCEYDTEDCMHEGNKLEAHELGHEKERERIKERLEDVQSGDDFLNLTEKTNIDGQELSLNDIYFAKDWFIRLVDGIVDDWRKK